MYDTLEQLRNKPEARRKKIVLVVSVTITIVIFFIWLSIFTKTVLEPNLDTREDTEEADTQISSVTQQPRKIQPEPELEPPQKNASVMDSIRGLRDVFKNELSSYEIEYERSTKEPRDAVFPETIHFISE